MLDPHPLSDLSHWYVVRAHHWQESRVEANLRSGDIETFLPRVRLPSRRRAQRRDHEPLFPQYLFARFDPYRSLHDVTFTRGVQSLVLVGGQLAIVDDAIIEFFRSRVDEHGFIPLCSELERGERVTIQEGPFADLTGIVERNLTAQQRIVVLLTSVARPVRVQVPADHLRRCEVGRAG
jgi:transcription elongation factor/antiterminator RfaH